MGIGSKAAELAAKMAKRLEILAAIAKVQGLIREAERVKNLIDQINLQITNSLNIWTNALSAFESSVMAPVVVTDKFEGESAEKISIRLPEPVTQMESTKASAEGVQGEIAVQITLLDTYIAEKETELDGLWAQYAAI